MKSIVTKTLGLAGKVYRRSSAIISKRKGKFAHIHAMEVHWENRGIDPPILNMKTRRR
jgi:hypothetical protein